MSERARDLASYAAVLLVAMGVYWQTLLVDLGFWDTAEYQTLGPVLGIAHPTGFPLYTVVSSVAAWLPVGSVAWRLNLFSAVCAGVAAAGVVAVARSLGASRGPAVGAGLAFAFHYPFWDNAIRAEAHTLHMALLVGVTWLALRWRATLDFRYMAGTALLTGIALCNHHLTALSVPATFVLICLAQPRLLVDAKRLGTLVGLGALGLSLYVFIPLRALQEPALNYARPFTWPRFRYLFFGEEFRHTMHYLSWDGPALFFRRMPVVVEKYLEWFTWPGGLVLGALVLVGLHRLARTDRAVVWFTALLAAIPLYMACNYQDADIRRYFFACTLVGVSWAAVAASWGLDAVRARRPRVVAALAVAIAVAPLGLVPTFYARIDRSGDWVGRVYADRVMDLVAPCALVVTWWNLATPLWYVRYVDGRRPDVDVVDTQRILDRGWGSLDFAIRHNLGRRPVYVQRFPDEFAYLWERFDMEVVEYLPPYGQPLFRIRGVRPAPRPAQGPPIAG